MERIVYTTIINTTNGDKVNLKGILHINVGDYVSISSYNDLIQDVVKIVGKVVNSSHFITDDFNFYQHTYYLYVQP